jgi:uncharacterized membrane protein YqiK
MHDSTNTPKDTREAQVGISSTVVDIHGGMERGGGSGGSVDVRRAALRTKNRGLYRGQIETKICGP